MATNRKLGRTTDIRLSMLKTQVTDLLWHGKIETTETRAKETKAIADSLIALAVKEAGNFEEVEVKVLAIDEEAGRVSLSLKATTPGPWDGVEQKLAAGDVIEGTVKRLTDFGAFVEVLPGIDGLVHISQISHKRVENPKDVLSVGQDDTVKVLEVNADAERVSLSIKALEERPANAEGENNEKRQSRPRRPKRQEKRDFELPETQSGFSMADLFGDIEL